MDAPMAKLRKHFVQFAVSHQGIAADDRKVQGLEAIDQLQHPLHQLVAFSVRQLPKSDFAAQMALIVCVTTRTSKRAFPGDFNGKGGGVAG